jgi:hypothetical protein
VTLRGRSLDNLRDFVGVFKQRAERVMAIRRWRVWSIVLAAAILPQALVHAAGAAGVPTAKDFETADQKDMPGMVLKILSTLPSLATDPVGRNNAIKQIGADFTSNGLGIMSNRAEVRLNSAILIGQFQTLDSDRFLKQMLKINNGIDDPTVRYHAAKGLGTPAMVKAEKDIAKQMGGGNPGIVADIAAAAKNEKVSVVKQELIKTLIAYDAADALIEATEGISAQMQTTAPDVPTLETAASAFAVIANNMSGVAAANKSKIPVAAVNAASYAIQHYRQAEKAAKEEERKVPDELTQATLKVIDSAVKAAAAASGKGFRVDSKSIDAAELDMNTVFGAAGGQGKAPGIPAPSLIKAE